MDDHSGRTADEGRAAALDRTDAAIALALTEDPRRSGVEVAARLGLSRNTVQARLARLEASGVLRPYDVRVRHRALGYPLTAFITAQVDQHRLGEVEAALSEVPEVAEVHGLAGEEDVLIRVVARDADDLYRIAGVVLALPGVERTNVALSMREMVPARTTPLLRALAERRASGT